MLSCVTVASLRGRVNVLEAGRPVPGPLARAVPLTLVDLRGGMATPAPVRTARAPGPADDLPGLAGRAALL